jgi:hypothetical protein
MVIGVERGLLQTNFSSVAVPSMAMIMSHHLGGNKACH